MLTGFIWNGRGFRDLAKKDFIRETTLSASVDFIGLQETIMQEYPDAFLSSLCGIFDFDWTSIPARGRSGGILVGVNRDTFQILEKDPGVYCVRVKLSNKKDGFCWNLIVVYGDAQASGKVAFLIELAQFINKSSLPMMIAGDFNLTRRDCDKNKPGGYNRWSILFNSIIAQGELMEIPLSGRKFTWSNNHKENPTYELLDRVLVSPAWEEKYPLVSVSALNRELSDHTPLLLTTGEKPKHPPIFRFENCWLLRPNLKHIIAREWNKSFRGRNLEDEWQNRMRNMRKSLQRWNRNVEGFNRKLKKCLLADIDKLDRLSELNGLTAEDRAAQAHLQQQLRIINREEEIKWIQRSKELELKEGDINSKYYHQKANGRSRKKNHCQIGSGGGCD